MMPIKTSLGLIEGTADGKTTRYAGIPYAKPPLGELRFRAPVPVEPWEGVLKADHFEKDPMQDYQNRPRTDFSEDCLYLNVWVPEQTEGEQLPVMIWIPGGAYATGGCGAPRPEGPSLYEGSLMATDMQAIVVTVSYRLNIFGFLNLSGLSDRFDDHLGLKDLVLAMKWVRDNIAAFGGDPGNVTLFGESAGAGCISTLFMVEEAQSLYHRAIMQSNCLGSYYTPEEEGDICRKFLSLAGLAETDAEGLLALDYDTLYQAAAKLNVYALTTYFPRCTFCPVVDGNYVKDYPTLADYTSFGKAILIGTNRYEGNFLMKSMKMTKEQSGALARNAFHRLPEEKVNELVATYPLPGQQAIADVLTDVMYTFPKHRWAERASRYVPVYVYRYDYATPVMNLMGFKACHVAEMLPLWNITAEPYKALRKLGEKKLQAIGTRMRKYWGAFARTGVPEVAGQAAWPAYDEKERQTLVIDTADHAESYAEKARMERFDGLDRIVV